MLSNGSLDCLAGKNVLIVEDIISFFYFLFNISDDYQSGNCAVMWKLRSKMEIAQFVVGFALIYCEEYQVELSAAKTKLMVFCSQETDYVKYIKTIFPIHIGDQTIPFVDSAEYVGILRSTTGNFPHLHQRIVKHGKALACLLFAGMSRRHRANPLSALRTDKIFCLPVLFPGLAALILSKSEIDIISNHVKQTTQDLLKLHQNTPEPFIFLMAGILPGEALLHIKQFTLFGMISRLPGNILNTIAKEILIRNDDKDKSWFSQIQSLCFRYGLPHPLSLLSQPMQKSQYKALVKLWVTDY